LLNNLSFSTDNNVNATIMDWIMSTHPHVTIIPFPSKKEIKPWTNYYMV
jgi:hypothetical protein